MKTQDVQKCNFLKYTTPGVFRKGGEDHAQTYKSCAETENMADAPVYSGAGGDPCHVSDGNPDPDGVGL